MNCLRQIVRLLRLASGEARRAVGLSGAQLFVLQKLAEARELSVNDLADRTHTHQSSVSVVVQALVERGLIARQRAAEDGRRLELSLTPAAKTLLRKAPGAAQDKLIGAIERLPQPVLTQLARNLSRLVHETGIDGEAPPMLFDEGEEPSSKTIRRKARRSR